MPLPRPPAADSAAVSDAACGAAYDQRAASDYQVEIRPCCDVAALAGEWQSLQSQIQHSLFVDWLWVSTWLESYPADVLVARTELAGELVALGLFSLRDERRHGLLHSRVARLHQTGVGNQDQIWIEYNGLLASGEHAGPALCQTVSKLLADRHCSEVHLSMLPGALGEQVQARLAQVRAVAEVPGFFFAYSGSPGSDPIDALSANTRAQIRRSLRLYQQQYGQARVQAAACVDQALGFFHEAGHWHKERWADSGFANPEFVAFHETLIKRGFDHGRTQLFSVAFGDYVSGVFYFLVDDTQAYFYLQGVRSESDGKLKPGLSGHYLLMRHFWEAGLAVYDFMGGDSQYKRQLSTHSSRFTSLRIHNGDRRFVLEQLARAGKNAVFGD